MKPCINKECEYWSCAYNDNDCRAILLEYMHKCKDYKPEQDEIDRIKRLEDKFNTSNGGL